MCRMWLVTSHLTLVYFVCSHIKLLCCQLFSLCSNIKDILRPPFLSFMFEELSSNSEHFFFWRQHLNSLAKFQSAVANLCLYCSSEVFASLIMIPTHARCSFELRCPTDDVSQTIITFHTDLRHK